MATTLKQWFEDTGTTQEAFVQALAAEGVTISRSALSQYVTGARKPRDFAVADAIQKATGDAVTVADLHRDYQGARAA